MIKLHVSTNIHHSRKLIKYVPFFSSLSDHAGVRRHRRSTGSFSSASCRADEIKEDWKTREEVKEGRKKLVGLAEGGKRRAGCFILEVPRFLRDGLQLQ